MATKKLTPDLTGHVLGGRYTVEALLGYGGFANVYRAIDERVRKYVAIKVLHPEHTRNIRDIERFRNEAEITGRINDDHFVRVTDSFQDEQYFCFVMEILNGLTLRDTLSHLGGRGMSWPRAFRISRQVCEGLEVAHHHDVVHRDIKPENIFLTRLRAGGEQVKLLDLGVAKILMDNYWSGLHRNLSNTGDIIGSPCYMAPELVQGSRACDARADIYSLGVVLYEMLTGVVPFRGNNGYETMYHHVHSTLVRPTVLLPFLNVPRALEDIVVLALSKDPEQRFRTAAEMEASIRYELENQSVEQRRVRSAQILQAQPDLAHRDTQPGHSEPVVDEPTTAKRVSKAPRPAESAATEEHEEPTRRPPVDAGPASPPSQATEEADSGTVSPRVPSLTAGTPSAAAAGSPSSSEARSRDADTVLAGPAGLEAKISGATSDSGTAANAPAEGPSDGRSLMKRDITPHDQDANEEKPTTLADVGAVPSPEAEDFSQAPLRARTLFVLGSLAAASLLATCSVSSALARVARGQDHVATLEATAQQPVATEASRPEKPSLPPPKQDPQHAANDVKSETDSKLGNDLGSNNVSKPGPRPAGGRGPTDEIKERRSPPTMKSIARKAAGRIKAECHLPASSRVTTAQYKVDFMIDVPSGRITKIIVTGDEPETVQCITLRVNNDIADFNSATDRTFGYTHSYSVIR